MANDSPCVFDLVLVRMENVSAFYPGSRDRAHILKNLTAEVRQGRHCVILGKNGSGKSSLLKLIYGDLQAASGKIYWRDNGELAPWRISAKDLCALVAPYIQENCQRYYAYCKTGDYLAKFTDPSVNFTEKARDLDAAGLLQMRIGQLSRGQLRFILLMQAMYSEKPLLLLDEYAEGLDGEYRAKVDAILAEAAKKVTILFTSHRIASIPDWCAEAWEMESGQLSTGQNVPEFTRERKASSHEHDGGEVLVQVRDATVFVDRVEVLHSLNWTLRQGEHWHINGANGSGKSTFLRTLAGDEFVAAGGRIERFDHLGGRLPDLTTIRKKFRLVSDLSQLFYSYDLSAVDLVCSGFDNSIGQYRAWEPKEIREAERMIAMFCPDIPGMSIRRLSTGLMRRLFLARALMGNPEVLLLDEACSGLDTQSRQAFLDLLEKLANGNMPDFAPSLVLAAHEAEDLPGCVNRFAQMRNGRLQVIEN